MKTTLILAISILYVCGVVYLTLPAPTTPDLSQSQKSDEPGDTWQNPHQKAFFTQKNRSQVLTEIQQNFSLSLFGFTIPSYRLNYRPEEATNLVRDQIQSYYLEEIVHPFRESLYVNGWEPQNSPINQFKPEKERDRVIINNVLYRSKVTLSPTTSQPLPRLVIWTAIFPAVWLVYYSFKDAIS